MALLAALAPCLLYLYLPLRAPAGADPWRLLWEYAAGTDMAATWFDPRRLRDDYFPTGFRGAGVKARAVRGHPFGLDLSAADRKALIAFLKTL